MSSTPFSIDPGAIAASGQRKQQSHGSTVDVVIRNVPENVARRLDAGATIRGINQAEFLARMMDFVRRVRRLDWAFGPQEGFAEDDENADWVWTLDDTGPGVAIDQIGGWLMADDLLEQGV